MNIADKIRIEIWRRRFGRAHPEFIDFSGAPEKLRLILAPGRSGTSWLGRTLSQTETPVRYIHEVLPHINPKYRSSQKYDDTAMRYHDTLPMTHPLVQIYNFFTSTEIKVDEKLFISRDYFKRKVIRDDKDFTIVLHKEVHALLATEGLLKTLKCPMVFITRNPIYVIDSLFTYQDISSPIWRNESNYIRERKFLNRFFPANSGKILSSLGKFPDDGVNRINVVIGKMITVAVMNEMLRKLANEYETAKHIGYKDMCLHPKESFKEIAAFFNLEFGDQLEKSIDETLMAKDEVFDPMSIHRNTKDQVSRSMRFLTDDEVVLAYSIMDDCGLNLL